MATDRHIVGGDEISVKYHFLNPDFLNDEQTIENLCRVSSLRVTNF